MAITTAATLADAIDAGRVFPVIKTSFGGGAGGGADQVFMSPWLIAGSPAAGVTPSSGVTGDVPTSATTGAFPFINPSSANTYLVRMTGNTQSTVIPSDNWSLYDRLWHNSGITFASGAQAVGSVALTRPDALGTAAEAWYQCYTNMGAGTPTVTLTYTNQSGTAGQTGTTVALPSAMPANRTGIFMLASGDTGVRAIATWNASATFTSGTIGLVIRRHIATMKVYPDVQNQIDAVGLAMPRVYDSACLEIVYHPFSNQTINLSGSITLASG